ncbi:MAG: T9SS type A sorting domain-containing protein [Flavobacteriales bacterium]|nr:T9SS type A sorting domain-containing protein [Flavobacteriales bacterium]
MAISGQRDAVGRLGSDEDVFGNNTIDQAGSAYLFAEEQMVIPTGLDASHTMDLRVYPVPTSAVLNLSFPDMRAYRAEVIGLDGRSVLALGIVHGRTPVDVSALASGAYLLRITSLANEVRFVRFVKE